MNSLPEKTSEDHPIAPTASLLLDKSVNNLNTGDESPILVQTSPLSSPVFVTIDGINSSIPCANSDIVTVKLVLPELDESTIKKQDTGNTNITLPENNVPSKDAKTEQSNTIDDKVIEEKAKQVVKDFKYCYDEVVTQIKNNNINITAESFVKILRIAITVVEQTSEPGSNKKQFVTKIVNDIFMSEASTFIEDRLHTLELLSGNILSDTIECIVDASKGKLDINKVEKLVMETGKSCFTECWSRIFKKK